MTHRRQIALFLPAAACGAIEHVRQSVDPVQFAKLPAHITLCYGDEIQDWDRVAGCLQSLAREEIRFIFMVDGSRPFDEGKGIYLQLTEQGGLYDSARSRLLAFSPSPRTRVKPHVTLLHPRHARDSPDGWTLVNSVRFPERMEIHRIAVIELREAHWTTVHIYGGDEPD